MEEAEGKTEKEGEWVFYVDIKSKGITHITSDSVQKIYVQLLPFRIWHFSVLELLIFRLGKREKVINALMHDFHLIV